MNILITGADGQLGRCLRKTYEEMGGVNSLTFHKMDCLFIGHRELDVTNYPAVQAAVMGHDADIVINCAAYTDVTGAENEPDKCADINTHALSALCDICEGYGTRLFQISSDFVFDGKKNIPYTVSDKPHPLSQYGLTKAAGESLVCAMKGGTVIRTGWLYSEYGRNFYTKVTERLRTLRSGDGEPGELIEVPVDQVGTPTYAMNLAGFILYLIGSRKYMDAGRIIHFSDEGAVSRYDFACAIERNLNLKELIYNDYGRGYTPLLSFVRARYSAEGSDGAIRPAYSVLDKRETEGIGYPIMNWNDALALCMSNDERL